MPYHVAPDSTAEVLTQRQVADGTKTKLLVCSDYDKTVTDIVTNYNANYQSNAVTTEQIAEKLNIPPEVEDVALCARSWRWEWFCLFFQFICVSAASIVTALPNRLGRSRFPLGNLFSIATAIIMVAVNDNITDVWFFWDSHKMFSEWTGVLKQLYFSAAALVAGWILVIVFNLVWIGFTGDQEDKKGECCPIQAQKQTETQA